MHMMNIAQNYPTFLNLSLKCYAACCYIYANVCRVVFINDKYLYVSFGNNYKCVRYFVPLISDNKYIENSQSIGCKFYLDSLTAEFRDVYHFSTFRILNDLKLHCPVWIWRKIPILRLSCNFIFSMSTLKHFNFF